VDSCIEVGEGGVVDVRVRADSSAEVGCRGRGLKLGWASFETV
jgi:hypothetical protein